MLCLSFLVRQFCYWKISVSRKFSFAFVTWILSVGDRIYYFNSLLFFQSAKGTPFN